MSVPTSHWLGEEGCMTSQSRGSCWPSRICNSPWKQMAVKAEGHSPPWGLRASAGRKDLGGTATHPLPPSWLHQRGSQGADWLQLGEIYRYIFSMCAGPTPVFFHPRVSSRLVEPPAPRESSAEAKCHVGLLFKIIIKHLGIDKYNEVSPPHKQVWGFKGVYRLHGTLWSQQGQNLGCWRKCSGLWSPSRVRDNRASWKSVVDERGRNKAAGAHGHPES